MIRDRLTERETQDGAVWKRGFTKEEAKKELNWLKPYIEDLKKLAGEK